MDSEFKFNAAIEYLFNRIKGITQKKVASETGLKQPEVSMIKTGERKGTLHQRKLLRDFFGLTENEMETLGNAIEAGVDPIGHPKVSFNQARLILQRFFDDCGMERRNNLTITFDAEGPPVATPSDIIDPIVKEHEKLIRQFPEPGKGLEMNREAVELAKIDPSEIDEIIEYIRYRKTKVRPIDHNHRKNGTDGGSNQGEA